MQPTGSFRIDTAPWCTALVIVIRQIAFSPAVLDAIV